MSVKWRQLGRQEAGVPEAPGDTPWWIVGVFLAFMPVFIAQHIWKEKRERGGDSDSPT